METNTIHECKTLLSAVMTDQLISLLMHKKDIFGSLFIKAKVKKCGHHYS